MINPDMQTLAVTTKPVSSSCLTCGSMKNSDKLSCCGRGGSWFGSCGVTGGTTRPHTWHEGILACAARQRKDAIAHELKVVPKNNTKPFYNGDNDVNTKTVTMAAHVFISTSTSISTSILTSTPEHLNSSPRSMAIPPPYSTTDMSVPSTHSLHNPDYTALARDNGARSSKAMATIIFFAWALWYMSIATQKCCVLD